MNYSPTYATRPERPTVTRARQPTGNRLSVIAGGQAVRVVLRKQKTGICARGVKMNNRKGEEQCH